jgi:hypothetical protein
LIFKGNMTLILPYQVCIQASLSMIVYVNIVVRDQIQQKEL